MFTSNMATGAAVVAAAAATLAAPTVEAGIVTQDRLSPNYTVTGGATAYSMTNGPDGQQAGLMFRQTLTNETSGGMAAFQMHTSIMHMVPGAFWVAPSDIAAGGQYAGRSWGINVSFWDSTQFNLNDLSQGFLGSSIHAVNSALSLVTTLTPNNPHPQYIWNASYNFALPEHVGTILMLVRPEYNEAENFRYAIRTTTNSRQNILAEGQNDQVLSIGSDGSRQVGRWPTDGGSLQPFAAIHMEITPVPSPGAFALGLAGMAFAFSRRRS